MGGEESWAEKYPTKGFEPGDLLKNRTEVVKR